MATTTKTASYFITTPYIDAYDHDYEGVSSLGQLVTHGRPKVTFEEFKQKMRAQASSWGEASVGRTMLDGKTPAQVHDLWVLAMGRWDGKPYVMLANGDEYELEEYDYPYEWDVT